MITASMRTTLFTVALAGTFALPPAALAAPGPEEDARILANPDGLDAADADRILDALIGVVERDTEGPLAQAALLAAREWWDEARDIDPLVARLEALAAKGLPQGDADETLRRTLGDRLLAMGRGAERGPLGMDAGYVQEWWIAGPFGGGFQAAIDHPFAPERNLDLEAPMAGRKRPVEWWRYRTLGVGEIIEPFQYLRPTDGTAYALSQWTVPDERTVVLKVTAWGTHRVTVNGEDVLTVNRLRDAGATRTHWVPVRLAAGWNRVMVKLAGSQGFALKVCDATTGLPVRDLAFETERTLHPATDAPAVGAAPAYRSNLAALNAQTNPSPALRVARALLRDSYQDEWGAYTDLETAAGAAADNPGIVLRFADFVRGFNEMPEPRWRKNRARGMYEDLLEKSPGHVPATLRLARILHNEDRTEEAIRGFEALPPLEEGATPDPAAAETRAAMERSRTLFVGLDAVLAKHPEWANGWYALAMMNADRKWWKEAEEHNGRALEANPRFLAALRYRLRIADSYKNTARSRAAVDALLAQFPGDPSARRRLADLQRDEGDIDGALATLDALNRDFPSDFRIARERADILASLRRYDDAITIYRGLAKQEPLEDLYPRKIGELQRYKGDDDAARLAWRRALAIEPSNGRLRRELERLEGGDFDFAARWAVDAEELWRACGDQEAYPKALAVHLIDHSVLRVNDDGSYSTITHNAWMILNEQGREKYQNINVPGTLLDVRAVSPEGEEFLPIKPFRGRNSFTLEGIQAGWLVEYRYLTDTRADARGFDAGQWYFQDPNFGRDGDPVVLSQYVLDLPAGLKVKTLSRNDAPEPSIIADDEAGRIFHIYTLRDQPRIEDEPRMPSADELCPFVWYYTAWDDWEINLEMQSDWGRFATSPLLDARARELLDGVEGNLARARVLYDFVNDYVTADMGGGGATGTLLEASGDRYSLFACLMLAAGVDFDLVQVATADDDQVFWEIPQPGHYGTSGLRVRGGEGGEDAYVFRFSRHSPFGRLPRNVRGRKAMVPQPGGAESLVMPAGDPAELVELHRLEVTLGDTPADTRFRARMVNPTEGWYGSKEFIKDQNEDDRRKTVTSLVGRMAKSPNVETFSYPGLETHGEPFTLEAAGKLPFQLREEGGALVLPLGPTPIEATRSYIERDTREYDLILRGERSQRDEVVVELGSGWKVARLPESLETRSNIGTYSLQIVADGTVVSIIRTIEFGKTRYRPDEYPAFVEWCREIDRIEEQRIVLEEVN